MASPKSFIPQGIVGVFGLGWTLTGWESAPLGVALMAGAVIWAVVRVLGPRLKSLKIRRSGGWERGWERCSKSRRFFRQRDLQVCVAHEDWEPIGDSYDNGALVLLARLMINNQTHKQKEVRRVQVEARGVELNVRDPELKRNLAKLQASKKPVPTTLAGKTSDFGWIVFPFIYHPPDSFWPPYKLTVVDERKRKYSVPLPARPRTLPV